MGMKKHSLSAAFGEGVLGQMVEEIHEDDGRRFGDSGRVSHKGMGAKKCRNDDPSWKKGKNWTPDDFGF